MQRKLILLTGILSFCGLHFGWAQKITFSYDDAGNQTERRLVCVNCTPQTLAQVKSVDKSSLSTKPVEMADSVLKLVAYPNPVTEILNVTWESKNTKAHVRRIFVYNSVGVKMYGREFNAQDKSGQIPFQSFLPGMYFIHVTYSNNRNQVVKVIKL